MPVTCVIEVQYVMAPGTALMQKRHGGDGVSVVIGGDAGTAEGDFASCMIWSTRPGNELPVLMIVTNNGYGISTPARTQHAERHISDRGEPFGIPGEVVDGNDPVASWHAVERAFDHCRQHAPAVPARSDGVAAARPLVVERGGPGADEPDCRRASSSGQLIEDGVIHRELAEMVWHEAREEADAAVAQAMAEPKPTADDVERFTYAPSRGGCGVSGGLHGAAGRAVCERGRMTCRPARRRSMTAARSNSRTSKPSSKSWLGCPIGASLEDIRDAVRHESCRSLAKMRAGRRRTDLQSCRGRGGHARNGLRSPLDGRARRELNAGRDLARRFISPTPSRRSPGRSDRRPTELGQFARISVPASGGPNWGDVRETIRGQLPHLLPRVSDDRRRARRDRSHSCTPVVATPHF